MKVRIIRGVYGHRPDKNESRVVRKDITSPPFELEDAEAERIIALEIAESCGEDSPQSSSDGTGAGKQNLMQEENVITEEMIMAMGYHDMKKMAKKFGLYANGTKEELQSSLKKALANINAGEEMQQKDAEHGDSEESSAEEDTRCTDPESESEEEPPMLEAQVPE